MPVSPELLSDLIRKMKEGTITQKEMALLQLYLSSPQSDRTMEEIDFSTFPDPVDSPGRSAEIRFEQIMALTHPQSASVTHWRKWVAAASLIFLAGSSITWLLLHRSLTEKRMALAASYSIFHSGDGELKQVRLPDGSQVSLNARTLLRYAQNFGLNDRVVELQEGEAFFEVKPDPAHPFIVISKKGVRTKVLGTSFDCKTYDSFSGMQISVKTGKVQVSHQDRLLADVLQAGDQLTYNVQEDKLSASKVDVNGIGNWRTGEVELQQADFLTMAEAIGQLYGIKLMAGSRKILNNHYSLRIHYHADIRTLIEAISAINGNQLRWESADTVYLY